MTHWPSVTVLTAPTGYPVSLQEAKAACRVTHADDDAQILGLIAAAVDEIDGPDGIGIAMLEQSWRLTLDRFPRGMIYVPGWPIASIDSVNYRDADGADQVMSSGNYTVSLREPVRIASDQWPTTEDEIGAVWVDYTVGVPSPSAVPENLRLAVQARVQQLYDAETFALLDQFIHATMSRYRRGMIAG